MDNSTTNPTSPPKPRPAPRKRIPKCTKGERYKVPGSEFDKDPDDSKDHPEWFYGVVTVVQKTGCKVLFEGDEIATRYNGHLETWAEYRIADDDVDDTDEEIFQAIEVKGNLRKAPKPVPRSRRRQTVPDDSSSDDSLSDGSSSDDSSSDGSSSDEGGVAKKRRTKVSPPT